MNRLICGVVCYSSHVYKCMTKCCVSKIKMGEIYFAVPPVTETCVGNKIISVFDKQHVKEMIEKRKIIEKLETQKSELSTDLERTNNRVKQLLAENNSLSRELTESKWRVQELTHENLELSNTLNENPNFVQNLAHKKKILETIFFSIKNYDQELLEKKNRILTQLQTAIEKNKKEISSLLESRYQFSLDERQNEKVQKMFDDSDNIIRLYENFMLKQGEALQSFKQDADLFTSNISTLANYIENVRFPASV